MNKPNVLEVKNLTKQFVPEGLFALLQGKKSSNIINDLSFVLAEGEVLGLLGPNGAGKTTTIQMLLSTLAPTSGTIEYFGKNLAMHRSEILQHIAFASTYVDLPGRLTVQENLIVSGGLYGFYGKQLQELVERFLKAFKLWDRRFQKTDSLSAGQKTRLMLTRAFMVQPKVLLLDEPTASLDPDVAYEVLEFIQQEQKERSISIFFTSHDMDEVMKLCNRVLVLKNGVLIANDAPSKLAAQVSTSHISLLFGPQFDAALRFFTDANIVVHRKDPWIIIDLDEHKIADLLMALAQTGLKYSSISIVKPSLEDYFFSISDSSMIKV